jgi:APA family basic amino acid/polyamine antiporter
MLLGTAVVTVLYLALNLSYLYALTPAELVAEPIDAVAVKAAQAALGPGAGRWMAALVAVSIVGAVSALVWAGPRVYFAMARDGLFPRALGATDGRGTPRRAILLQSAWASVLVATGTYEALVVYSSFVLIACNALAVGALIVLRRRAPDLERPFRVPAYPWTPLLFLAVSAALLAAALALRPRESLLGVATVVGGLPLCLWFERRARRGGERATSR